MTLAFFPNKGKTINLTRVVVLCHKVLPYGLSKVHIFGEFKQILSNYVLRFAPLKS